MQGTCPFIVAPKGALTWAGSGLTHVYQTDKHSVLFGIFVTDGVRKVVNVDIR